MDVRESGRTRQRWSVTDRKWTEWREQQWQLPGTITFSSFFLPLNEPTTAATTPNISLMTSPSAQMIHLDTFTTNKPCQTLPSQRRRLLFCLRVTRGKYVWLREINYSDSFFFHWLNCFVHFYETLRSVCIYIIHQCPELLKYSRPRETVYSHTSTGSRIPPRCVCVCFLQLCVTNMDPNMFTQGNSDENTTAQLFKLFKPKAKTWLKVKRRRASAIMTVHRSATRAKDEQQLFWFLIATFPQ